MLLKSAIMFPLSLRSDHVLVSHLAFVKTIYQKGYKETKTMDIIERSSIECRK